MSITPTNPNPFYTIPNPNPVNPDPINLDLPNPPNPAPAEEPIPPPSPLVRLHTMTKLETAFTPLRTLHQAQVTPLPGVYHFAHQQADQLFRRYSTQADIQATIAQVHQQNPNPNPLDLI